MDDIRNREKIMSILNRYKDYPVSDIFKIKYFFNLLIANIFIYTRYQIMLVTFSELQIQRKLAKDQDYYHSGVNENPDVFYIFANVFQVIIGAMTAKFYHGRRFLLIFCVILASIISELFLYFLRLFFENQDLGDALKEHYYIVDQ